MITLITKSCFEVSFRSDSLEIMRDINSRYYKNLFNWCRNNIPLNIEWMIRYHWGTIRHQVEIFIRWILFEPLGLLRHIVQQIMETFRKIFRKSQFSTESVIRLLMSFGKHKKYLIWLFMWISELCIVKRKLSNDPFALSSFGSCPASYYHITLFNSDHKITAEYFLASHIEVSLM